MAKTPINTDVDTFIYTLEDPDTNEIRYIGKTVKQLKHRLSDHIYSCNRESNYRTNWIKSILKKNKKPIIKLLDTCKWSESQELESNYIASYRANGFRLVNLTDGGEGCLGLKLKQSVIDNLRKISIKEIHQYDLDGTYINSYESITLAAITINGCSSKIVSCAKGKRKMHAKFQWSYEKKDSLDKYIKEKINRKLTEQQRNKAVKNLKGYGKYFT